MGTCKYYGQSAGFFSRTHKECEEKHERGPKGIGSLKHRYFSNPFTTASLKTKLAKKLTFIIWTAYHNISNKRSIWIEPIDYADKLTEAVLTLAQWRKEVAVYNVPLCLIPESIHSYAQKSISDWKNKFLPECDHCSLKSKCCGLFTTSKKTFKGIKTLS
jgi:hypothetical protein